MTDGQMALCRHCGSKLHQAAGFWVDADGSAVCMRGPDRVPHQPMPAGMRGAPGTIL